MFGTLVIQLPSVYEGGQLTVFQQGKESEFNFGGFDACNNIYFAAFYADCQHEVKPITKGHRLCLIYNLIYTGFGRGPVPPNNQKTVSSIVSAMKAWNGDVDSNDSPKILIQMLEHQYCKASLSFQMLKNGDKALAEVLQQAKKEAEFDLYLSVVELTQYFSATYYGRGKYTIDDDGDDHFHATHLTAYDSEKLSTKIDLDDDDSIFPQKFFDGIDPYEEGVEEATGNEGATVDKHYHWAALLIWPAKRRRAVIGMQNVIEEFERDLKSGKAEDKLEDDAMDIIKHLKDKDCRANSQVYKEFLQLLLLVGKRKLIVEYLNVMADCASYLLVSYEDNNIISSVGNDYGWGILKLPLESIFAKCSYYSVEDHSKFLVKFCSLQSNDEQKNLFKSVAAIFVNFLANEQDGESRYYKPNRSKNLVCQFVHILKNLECESLLTTLVNALLTKPIYYPVLETLGPAVVDVSNTFEISGPLQVLCSHCISTLEEAISKVQPPTTHARPVKLYCSCDNCTEVKQFMEHPDIAQCRFRVVKEKRLHIEDRLRRVNADVICQTEHVGTPHTLVVSKTLASFEREVEKHQVHRDLLASLQSLIVESEPLTKKVKLEPDIIPASEPVE